MSKFKKGDVVALIEDFLQYKVGEKAICISDDKTDMLLYRFEDGLAYFVRDKDLERAEDKEMPEKSESKIKVKPGDKAIYARKHDGYTELRIGDIVTIVEESSYSADLYKVQIEDDERPITQHILKTCFDLYEEPKLTPEEELKRRLGLWEEANSCVSSYSLDLREGLRSYLLSVGVLTSQDMILQIHPGGEDLHYVRAKHINNLVYTLDYCSLKAELILPHLS